MLPNPEPKLIVIAAPSGAGKTTLCEMLLKEFPEITPSISTTTRQKRPYEIEGVHYHFVTASLFQNLINKGAFAEWAEVHGNRYGSSKKNIEENLKQGKHVLFDIDIQGAMNLVSSYGSKHVLLIFIHPPSIAVLEQRLIDRKGDSPNAIEKRLQNARNELESSKKFKYKILNDDLEKAYQTLKRIIQKECLERKHL